jgi:hypothetical protein
MVIISCAELVKPELDKGHPLGMRGHLTCPSRYTASPLGMTDRPQETLGSLAVRAQSLMPPRRHHHRPDPQSPLVVLFGADLHDFRSMLDRAQVGVYPSNASSPSPSRNSQPIAEPLEVLLHPREWPVFLGEWSRTGAASDVECRSPPPSQSNYKGFTQGVATCDAAVAAR